MKYFGFSVLAFSSAVLCFARTADVVTPKIDPSPISREPFPIEPKQWTCVNQVKLSDDKATIIQVKIKGLDLKYLPGIFAMNIEQNTKQDTSTLTMSWSMEWGKPLYSYKLYIWDKAKSGISVRASHVVRSRFIRIGLDSPQSNAVQTTLPAALTSEHKIHDVSFPHVFQYALLVYDIKDKDQKTPLNLGHECEVTQH